MTFKTEQERNDYIEMLVEMKRRDNAWLGKEAQDFAEAKVRFDWSGAAGPKPDWRRSQELELARLREERKESTNYDWSMILYRKICDIENSLACVR
jgi:hypothetical protein